MTATPVLVAELTEPLEACTLDEELEELVDVEVDVAVVVDDVLDEVDVALVVPGMV